MYTISDQPGFKLSSNLPEVYLDYLIRAKSYADTQGAFADMKRSLNRLLESAARLDPAIERDLREVIPTFVGVIARIQEDAHAQLATAKKAVRDFKEGQRPTP